ncbi:MAG: glycosyltransferase family 4 protein [Candidatus Pacebacteria bacterium]|nr:glycosyltransferase family 4 protein [Candidatus Paceibacterota bacterium]
MKVGLISFHSFLQPGGVKRHILGLHDEFKKRGIKVKIIVPRREEEENYGKDVILLGTSFSLPVIGTQADFCINFNPFAIKDVLEKEKFDVLHFHNIGFPSSFQILDASESLNVLTFHANLEKVTILKTFPSFASFVSKAIGRKMDGIIGVAPLNLKLFKNYKGPKRVIPNGINLNEFKPQGPKIEKYLDGKINILFLGRIEERKGLIYLIRALKILNKKHSNLRLIVAGEGPLKEECREWAQNNGLNNVVFETPKGEKEASAYYRTCDIYCSPAIYGESFGIVLIEAMATKKPVVAFANKGYQGVLGEGMGGRFLARPKDYKTLAEKLDILIESKSLREEMGEWGRQEAEKYSWEKIADQVLEFYEICRKKKEEGK